MKNQKATIKCVMFDVGGVLSAESIDPVHDILNKKLGKKAFIRKSAGHHKLLKGEIKEHQFYSSIARKTDTSPEYIENLFLSTFDKIMKTNKKTLSVAKNLRKKGYKIGILSNITTNTKKVYEKRGIFGIFSPMIFSCGVGLMKPQKKIYQLAIKKTGLKPEEIVYTDDRKEFLETPKKLGMKTIHFRNANQLKRDLKKLGVKI